jgi:hypothetical protein
MRRQSADFASHVTNDVIETETVKESVNDVNYEQISSK